MEIKAFIREYLTLTDGPVRLYQANARSGLSRLQHVNGAPYWAYTWAGGLVLAEAVARTPALVAGRKVVDFGCGSGLVGIAAAKAGAAQVWAMDTDPNARAAAEVNAEANGIRLESCASLPEGADVILAGDVFYDDFVASLTLRVLRDAAHKGIEVLVGDPGRKPLPLDDLTVTDHFEVRDFGSSAPVTGSLYRLQTGV